MAVDGVPDGVPDKKRSVAGELRDSSGCQRLAIAPRGVAGWLAGQNRRDGVPGMACDGAMAAMACRTRTARYRGTSRFLSLERACDRASRPWWRPPQGRSGAAGGAGASTSATAACAAP